MGRSEIVEVAVGALMSVAPHPFPLFHRFMINCTGASYLLQIDNLEMGRSEIVEVASGALMSVAPHLFPLFHKFMISCGGHFSLFSESISNERTYI